MLLETNRFDYVAYTDGSCLKEGREGTGSGGCAALVFNNKTNEMKELSEGYKNTTNNRMEMKAVQLALNEIPKGKDTKTLIITDSTYVAKAFNDHWIDNWIKNGWKNVRSEPVKNKELWEVLVELVNERNVTFYWVKGHDGNEYNEIADALAKKEALSAMQDDTVD